MINLICLINLFLQSFKVDRETSENLKGFFSSFSKKENSIADPADFSFKAAKPNRIGSENEERTSFRNRRVEVKLKTQIQNSKEVFI